MQKVIGMGLMVAAALTGQAKPKNVLLICVDDLRPELNCFGALKGHLSFKVD